MGANVSRAYENRGIIATKTHISPPTQKGRVITFHSSSKWKSYFEATKQTSKLIVLYFTASWCNPCQFIQPAVIEFAGKYTDVEFIKIDVDELFGVAQGFKVTAMPTFILMKAGKEVAKVVGAKREDLGHKIAEHKDNNPKW